MGNKDFAAEVFIFLEKILKIKTICELLTLSMCSPKK